MGYICKFFTARGSLVPSEGVLRWMLRGGHYAQSGERSGNVDQAIIFGCQGHFIWRQ